MQKEWAKQKGFTIVELLIVIVIIGILAALVIVAYNGIQQRANDASVQSELSQIKKKLELYKVDYERYPSNNTELETATKLKANKASYAVGPAVTYNLLLCTPNNFLTYVLAARTATGSRLYISDSTGGVQAYTGGDQLTSSDPNVTCGNIFPGSNARAAGYNANDTATGPWRAWAGGN